MVLNQGSSSDSGSSSSSSSSNKSCKYNIDGFWFKICFLFENLPFESAVHLQSNFVFGRSAEEGEEEERQKQKRKAEEGCD